MIDPGHGLLPIAVSCLHITRIMRDVSNEELCTTARCWCLVAVLTTNEMKVVNGNTSNSILSTTDKVEVARLIGTS